VTLKPQTEIAILDDHIIFLDAITLLIESLDARYKVSRFSSPIEILKDVEKGRKFDLILCDLIMNTMNGLAFLGALRSHTKSIPVIILSGINTAPPVRDIKRIGGNGFVHKSAQNDDLTKAIKTVLSGNNFFEDGLGNYIVEKPSEARLAEDSLMDYETLPRLGARQAEVLRLIANGYANKDIARNLSISENTVKTHLKQIFKELAVNNRTACVRKAQALGII